MIEEKQNKIIDDLRKLDEVKRLKELESIIKNNDEYQKLISDFEKNKDRYEKENILFK